MAITLAQLQRGNRYLQSTSQSSPSEINLSLPRQYSYDKSELMTALTRQAAKILPHRDDILSFDIATIVQDLREETERFPLWVLKRTLPVMFMTPPSSSLSPPSSLPGSLTVHQCLRIHLGGTARLLHQGKIMTRYLMKYHELLPVMITEVTDPRGCDLLANEFLVGLSLNKLRHYVRNFGYVYTLGQSDPFIPITEDTVLAHIHNQPVNPVYKGYSEYLPGITLRRFLGQATSAQFKAVIAQILYALAIAHHHCSFRHHRLHSENIIIDIDDQIKVLTYHLPDMTDRMIITTHRAVIVDYKTATTTEGYHPLTDVVTLASDIIRELLKVPHHPLLPVAMTWWHLLVDRRESIMIADYLSSHPFACFEPSNYNIDALIGALEYAWELPFTVPFMIPPVRKYHLAKIPRITNVVINYQLTNRDDGKFSIVPYQHLYTLLESTIKYATDVIPSLITDLDYGVLLTLIQRLEDAITSMMIIGIHLDTSSIVDDHRMAWTRIRTELFSLLQDIDRTPRLHPPHYSLIRPLLFREPPPASGETALTH